MTISANDVKLLREKTGAGMMDCKNALSESNGDFEKAIEFLRKKGLATAAKRADRAASEGVIGSYLSADCRHAVLVEVNCETDFVAKNDDFQNFVKQVTKLVADNNPANMDVLKELKLGTLSLQDTVATLVGKIGENIAVRRFTNWKADAGSKLGVYIHAGSKIGVLVKFEDKNNKLSADDARDVAMHIAAMSPQYVNRDEVPANVLEKEKEIQRAQLATQNKPADIIEKIVIGKMSKYYSEVCVNEQVYVKDPEGKKTVEAALKAIDAGVKLTAFARLQVGEGVQATTQH